MPYILYPILLCLIPVHALYAQNISEISKDSYFKASAAVMSILIFVYSFLYLVTHNSSISAFLLSFNFYLLLYANYLFIGMFSLYKRKQQKYKIIYSATYITSCVLLSLILYFGLKEFNLELLNKILFYISSTMSFFIFLDIFKKTDISQQALKGQHSASKTNNLKNNAAGSSPPDIYHIILDEHAGFFNKELCDDEFKTALEERGFHIYENFRSNYSGTSLSLPSMFNMDYIHNLIKNQNSYPTTITYPLYAENFVHKKLENMGYNCNLFINRLMQCIFNKKHHKTNINTDNQLEKLLIFRSIIKSATSVHTYDYSNNFIELTEAFTEDGISEPPQYKFMHALAPHSPYFYDEFGNKLNPTTNLDTRHYFSYLKYVDKNIIKSIDKIKSKMKKNSIIIIHSDHSFLQTPWNILCAVYFPNPDDYKSIPDDGTLVNLFRYLFNKIFSTNYEMLDNIIYSHDCNSYVINEIENIDIKKKRQVKNEHKIRSTKNI